MRKFISNQLNKNDGLIKHSLVVFIAVGIVSILNYVFHLYMGRALGPEEYSILGVLFSLFYILNAPASTIDTIITKFSSEFKAKGEYSKIRYLLVKSFKLVIFYGIIFLIVYGLLSRYIASFLKIDSITAVILMGVMIFLSFLFPVVNSLLRGLQKFNWYNANILTQAALKLILGITLVSLGFGVIGAISAINIATLIVILLPFIPLAFLFRYKGKIEKLNIFKYSLVILVGSFVMMLMVNVDVILVKHFFPALEAGYYVAASILAKIVWFASGALMIVMFPKISDYHSNNRDTSSILKYTLFYTFLISLIVILIYFIAPTFVVNMLYGQEYKIDGIIGLFAIGLGFFSLSNVLVLYNFAVNKSKFIYLIILSFMIETGLIVLFHSSLLEVVKILAVVNILLFFVLVLYTRREFGIKNGFKA